MLCCTEPTSPRTSSNFLWSRSFPLGYVVERSPASACQLEPQAECVDRCLVAVTSAHLAHELSSGIVRSCCRMDTMQKITSPPCADAGRYLAPCLAQGPVHSRVTVRRREPCELTADDHSRAEAYLHNAWDLATGVVPCDLVALLEFIATSHVCSDLLSRSEMYRLCVRFGSVQDLSPTLQADALFTCTARMLRCSARTATCGCVHVSLMT